MRHKSLFHRRTTASLAEPAKAFVCNICQRRDASQATLNRHKQKEGHDKRTNPPAASDATQQPTRKQPKRTTKPISITDLLRQHNSRDEGTDGQGGSEDVCSAKKCLIEFGQKNAVIVWVECDGCENWFHSVCIGLGDKTGDELKAMNYVCDDCA